MIPLWKCIWKYSTVCSGCCCWFFVVVVVVGFILNTLIIQKSLQIRRNVQLFFLAAELSRTFPHYFTKFKPASKVSSTTFVTHFVNFHNCWFILLSHGPPIFTTSLSWRGPFFKLNDFPTYWTWLYFAHLGEFYYFGGQGQGQRSNLLRFCHLSWSKSRFHR